MGRWPSPKSPTSYFVILLVGAFFLPISPLLSIAVIFLMSHIENLPSIEQVVNRLTRKKRVQQRELDLRNESVQKDEKVFFCRSCGAAYTAEFLDEFSIPDNPNSNKQDVDIQNTCYYCGSKISVASHPQSYYEQQANTENVNISGENLFPKPLRFRPYVLLENKVNPDPTLLREYLTYLEKQVFIHYVIYIQLVRRYNPNADVGFEKLAPMMSYTMNLSEMCKKYDIAGKTIVSGLDLFYPIESSVQSPNVLTE